ncbi:hypothetical protein GOBAR_AA36671 [Gossypium barbadense]|uniref:YqaJ viral recombinase domain-containing protein n=2 Tax=Gossypium TaxID=3633 RepID=A0A2P5VYZ1_GOSBA|nr:hypothetical protein GOBAR_AA36671 [Gossypium barbadense]
MIAYPNFILFLFFSLLGSEMLAYCFPLIIQLSNYKIRIIRNIGLLVGNLKYRRTYSSENLLEAVSGRLITSSQFVNHPFQRSFSQSKKLGAIEPFYGNLATCWGNIKEEEAFERYKQITGNTIEFPEFQVYGKMNPEDNWLAASPDGLVNRFVYGLPPGGVLEIKCPYIDGKMSEAFPWKRIPLYCIPQAQGLMEIMDREWMDFYVWTPNGSSLFRIYRDVKYWNVLKSALSDFWWKHVQPAKEICSKNVITDPLRELKSLRPDSRHESCGDIVRQSKLVADTSNLLICEINGQLIT